MILISITYINDVDEYRTDHRSYLSCFYKRDLLIASGPRKDGKGGFIITNFKDQNLAQEFINNDPFFVNKVAEYEIIEFEAVLKNDSILNLK